ncbi:MAG: four helix bundle protein [Gemmatimonadetes bacterium]|nr:four helix bundle protein [Gemmatimonadota bacterium]
MIAWQRAHAVVLSVLDASERFWRPSAAAVFGQLQRAALSVQLNIAEGYALRSTGLLRRHLTIAYGSAVETSDLLEILDERDPVPREIIAPAVKTGRETQALLMGLLRKARQ